MHKLLPNKPQEQVLMFGFKFYNLFFIFTLILGLIEIFYYRRYVICLGTVVLASSILFVMSRYLLQMIVEMYGYEYARQALLLSTIAKIIIMIMIFFVINDQDDLTNLYPGDYKNLFTSNREFCLMLCGLCINIIVDFFIIRLSSKIKTYYSGKYIVIRLLSIHISSELIVFVLSTLFLWIYHSYNFGVNFTLLLSSLIFGLALSLALMPFVVSLCSIVLSIEGQKGVDKNQDYKIFDLNINFNKIELKKYVEDRG